MTPHNRFTLNLTKSQIQHGMTRTCVSSTERGLLENFFLQRHITKFSSTTEWVGNEHGI